MKLSRASLLAGVAFAALAAGLGSQQTETGLIAPPEVQAQNLGQRVVYGFVIDDAAAPVKDARVFLKYLKTKSIRSYTTQPDGKFRFTQVNMADDYELWAEKDSKKSEVKTVSQWDARKEFEVDLKLK